MEAVSRGWDLSMRRAIALFLGLVAVALIAGGAGGYLTRGVTTRVVTQTVIRPVQIVPAPAHVAAPPGPVARTSGGYIAGL